MKPERADYDRLVESLADGLPLDWAALSAKVSTANEARQLQNLRLVARIAEIHRTIALEQDADDSVAVGLADGTVPPVSAWGHLEISQAPRRREFRRALPRARPSIEPRRGLEAPAARHFQQSVDGTAPR